MGGFLQEIRLKREEVPDFRAYPFSIPAIRKLDTLKLDPKVTFFIGENGMGKSTLLEAAAVNFGFNPEGGSRNFRFSTYASHSCLSGYLRLIKSIERPKDGYFFRAESFYNVATNIEELDAQGGLGAPISASYGGNLHERSHGESFFALLNNRLGWEGALSLRRTGSGSFAPAAACYAAAFKGADRSWLPVHHCYTLAHPCGVSGEYDLRIFRGGDPEEGLRRNGSFPDHPGFLKPVSAYAK